MKEYTKTLSVGSLKLTREDLHQLVQLIHQGHAARQVCNFIISTQLRELEITDDDLGRFLLHSELPGCLDNISVDWQAIRMNDGYAINKISLQLGKTSSQLQVSSINETWMLGKRVQLQKPGSIWYTVRPFGKSKTKRSPWCLPSSAFWPRSSLAFCSCSGSK
jgi:hypothetical protein